MTYEIALVGAGRIGQIHAESIKAHPELTLRYVIDPNASNALAAASRSNAAATSLEAALADPSVDAVVVASSTDAHLTHCLATHRAGKAIFCEKPIGLDLTKVKSARSELAAARMLVGFNRRFDRHFMKLTARVSDGTIGRIETVQITSNDPAPPPISYIPASGGLFRDMSIHDFDMARYLLDEEPSEVFATGSCLIDPMIGEAGDIDTARIILRTTSGRMCVIANSRRSGFGYDQRIEVFGSEGMVTAQNEKESTVQVWNQSGCHTDGLLNFFLQRYADAYQAEMDHFVDLIAGRAKSLITFSDGEAALRVAEAASESLNMGRPVQISLAT